MQRLPFFTNTSCSALLARYKVESDCPLICASVVSLSNAPGTLITSRGCRGALRLRVVVRPVAPAVTASGFICAPLLGMGALQLLMKPASRPQRCSDRRFTFFLSPWPSAASRRPSSLVSAVAAWWGCSSPCHPGRNRIRHQWNQASGS